MSWYQRLQDEGLVIWDGRNFTPSFTITEKGRKAYAEVAAPVGEW